MHGAAHDRGVRRPARPTRPARRRTRILAGAACAIAVVASCAVPPEGSTAPIRTPHLEVPAIPLALEGPLLPSSEDLELAACAECERPGGGDPDRFVAGRLALATMDELAVDPAGATRAGAAGPVFVAGYFGGIQLRGALSDGGVERSPASPLADVVSRSTAAGLADQVGRLARTAADGSEAQVRAAARQWLPVLSVLYGYNLGYVEVATSRPPPGATGAPLECPTRLSCRAGDPGLDLAAAGAVAGAFDALEDPPDPRWARLADAVDLVVDATVPLGRSVWTGILDGSSIEAESYPEIMDLSGAFLHVSSVVIAGLAQLEAGGDAGAGRSALAVLAGLITWAGSYFLGLASPLGDEDLPVLRCD